MGDIIIPSEKKGWFVMKALSVSRLCLAGALMFGVFVAWDACLAQKVDINMKVGNATYCCSSDVCDWHAVSCEAKKNETCSKSYGCCRGPDTGSGDCTDASGYQCTDSGCKKRTEEICNE